MVEPDLPLSGMTLPEMLRSVDSPADMGMCIRNFSFALCNVGLTHIYEHSKINTKIYTLTQQELDRRTNEIILKSGRD